MFDESQESNQISCSLYPSLPRKCHLVSWHHDHYTLMSHTHFISNFDFSPELQTSSQTAIRHLTWLPDIHLKFNLFKTNSWLSCLTLFLPYLSSSSQLIAPSAHAKNLGISIDSFFPSLPKCNSNKFKYPNSDTSYHFHLFHPSPSHHLLTLELLQ